MRSAGHAPVVCDDSAASGTTDTVSAATAGERPQPSTSRSTSRNSAAVSAADSSTSVTFGPIAGRCRSRREARGTPRTASAAGTASTATGTCTTKIACHAKASVSSPPTTGPAAVPTTPGRDPQRDPAPLAGLLDQQLQAADERERAAERLHAASRDQHLHRPAERAHQRRAGEHRDPDRAQRCRVAAAVQQGRRYDHEREHEVERDQHPRDLGDRPAKVLQDVGQRERDDRGVGQHERHGHREQRNDGATHRLILTGGATGSCLAGRFS